MIYVKVKQQVVVVHNIEELLIICYGENQQFQNKQEYK